MEEENIIQAANPGRMAQDRVRRFYGGQQVGTATTAESDFVIVPQPGSAAPSEFNLIDPRSLELLPDAHRQQYRWHVSVPWEEMEQGFGFISEEDVPDYTPASTLPGQEFKHYAATTLHVLTLEQVASERRAAQFEQRFRELERLVTLETNWNSYGAKPPNASAIRGARQALGELERTNVLPTRIVPSAEDGVGIVFTTRDKYADIEFFNSGEVVAIISRGQDSPLIWQVAPTQEDLRRALDTIRDYLSD